MQTNSYVYLIEKNGTVRNLTNFVTYPLNLSDSLGEILATATINIPAVKSNSISGMTLSNKIEQLSRIEISVDGEIFRYLVMEDAVSIVKKGTVKLYSHALTLIEPTEYLKHKNISAFSITQPKSTNLMREFSYGKGTVDLSSNTHTVSFTTYQYGDIGYVEDRVLKQIGNYTASFTFYTKVYNNSQGNFQFNVDFYRGINLIDTKTISINSNVDINKLMIHTFSSTFYKNTTTDEQFYAKITVLGGYYDPFPGTFVLNPDNESNWLYLQNNDSNYAVQNTYLDEAVDKVFDLIKIHTMSNVNFSPEFRLGDLTRSKISGILSPELSFDRMTAFDAINVIASYVKASPRLGYDDFTTLEFDYIDPEDNETFEITDYIDKEVQAILDNFNSGLEINADNVIESNIKNEKIEPYALGWMSVRGNADGPIQLTDTTAAIVLRQNIYRITKLEVKGITVVTSNRTLPSSTVYDLTDYVVERKQYNALSTQLNRGLVGINTQGNTIYYAQGDRRILNLGYTSPTDPALYAFVERALFEAIYDKVLLTYPSDSLSYNQNQTSHAKFENVLFRVSYIPMSSARAIIRRHDYLNQTYQTESYINESSRLIDSETLGEYSRKSANRSAMDQITYTGMINDIENLPDIGYKDADNNIVSSYSISVASPNIRTYSLVLQPNFTGLNPLVQVPSAYRQYEVPDEEIVSRQDIYEEAFIFSKYDYYVDKTIYNQSDISLTYFANPFIAPSTSFPTTMKPISYCKFGIRNDSKEIDDLDFGTFDLQLDLPVELKSFGNTLTMKVEMDDNYSVGPILKKVDPAKTYENSAILQYDLPYGNVFGRFDSARVSMYTYGYGDNTWADAQSYPMVNTTGAATKISEADFRIKKDSREKYNFIQQINMVSADENEIRVYPGAAKYNGWNSEKEDHTPSIVYLDNDYFPAINAKYIDLRRTDPAVLSTWNSTILNTIGGKSIRLNNTMLVNSETNYSGYALINRKTNELIYAVKKDMTNNTGSVISITDNVYIIPRFIP